MNYNLKNAIKMKIKVVSNVSRASYKCHLMTVLNELNFIHEVDTTCLRISQLTLLKK